MKLLEPWCRSQFGLQGREPSTKIPIKKIIKFPQKILGKNK